MAANFTYLARGLLLKAKRRLLWMYCSLRLPLLTQYQLSLS